MTPIEELRAAGIERAERDWQILQNNFSGDDLQKALQKRARRVPMAQILGFRDFWKDRFLVNEHVLDPRPDSELFLELALSRKKPFHSILDLGAGSGALGLSALREFPNAKLCLADQSLQALDIARKNAQALGLGGRVQILHSNWFENIESQFDLILCNPPYLSQSELDNAQAELHFEPEAALSDFGDGLSCYQIIAPKLENYLAKDGIAYFEHGATQQQDVAKIFSQNGFEVHKFNDLSNNPRIIGVFLPI